MMTEGAFEAKKYGWRQTQGGIIVSFLVHPNDINAALAVAPLGTIYAIGFREMPEGDQSASPEADAGRGAPAQAVVSPPAPALTEAVAVSAPKQRRPMTRAQVAGMLCHNPVFQRWLLGERLFDGTTSISKDDLAADHVRQICGIPTRAALETEPDAASKWDALHARYRTETGQEAEQRA